jgi:DNA-binding MarR family transcriptional regulator
VASREEDPIGTQGEILWALAIGGRSSVAELAVRTGSVTSDVSRSLDALERTGDAVRGESPDRVDRFRLTSQGQSVADASSAADRHDVGVALERILPDFDAANVALKDLLHRWQMRMVGTALVVNDHTDAGYDGRILGELGRLLTQAKPWLDPLSMLRPRYALYRERLSRAADRAGRGELDFVSGLSVDSVHSIWWQLHSDLLFVLGRERGDRDV